MTFLPFLLNRSRLPICSYNFFLFWPVPLKSVKKKKSIYACILIKKISKTKKKKSIYACIVINKISKKKKMYYFFLFWPVTLKSVKKKSIYACILINKI